MQLEVLACHNTAAAAMFKSYQESFTPMLSSQMAFKKLSCIGMATCTLLTCHATSFKRFPGIHVALHQCQQGKQAMAAGLPHHDQLSKTLLGRYGLDFIS